ncbi:MAG: hypothetical protein Q8P24_01365 [Desulfobacterales bacterium]|nr:hypothetical protein [Desulfobacterales bacterium]
MEFRGKIVRGQGDHAKLGIPGKGMLAHAPADWPDILYPGSLNVLISIDNLPKELQKLGDGTHIQKLDNGMLKPAFVIEQRMILNNTIGPNERVKGRGDAQVWRVKLTVEKSKECLNCWVLRRLDSAMTRHIEIVAEKYLRGILKLNDGDDVIVSFDGEHNDW